jgi:GalNAc-alpha-(1->4)-GalNAc-alpha-(1->3)-diNAcBac-PP-undecaprenol alpha-1,4-N-acetyl-D-galactosaminyltransferase
MGGRERALSADRTILIVLPSLAGGGAERAAARLGREWSRDHDVFTAVFNGKHPAYEPGGTLINLDIPAKRGAAGKVFNAIRRVLALRRVILERRPDRMFAFMESAGLPLLMAALLYPLADEVILVSRGAAEHFVARPGWSGCRVRVAYSPIPLEEIGALCARAEDASEPTPYFFAAGRLVPGKDFARIIRLFGRFARAPGMSPGMRLLVAGEGPERAGLEALIREEGLAGRVVLSGRVENPFARMARATAFLMASRHEGFPNVIPEALACGCPVIAFDCEFGPAEAIGGHGCGVVVPMEDDDAFLAAMTRLAVDPVLRERMGAAARRRAGDFGAARLAGLWLTHGEDAGNS